MPPLCLWLLFSWLSFGLFVQIVWGVMIYRHIFQSLIQSSAILKNKTFVGMRNFKMTLCSRYHDVFFQIFCIDKAPSSHVFVKFSKLHNDIFLQCAESMRNRGFFLSDPPDNWNTTSRRFLRLLLTFEKQKISSATRGAEKVPSSYRQKNYSDQNYSERPAVMSGANIPPPQSGVLDDVPRTQIKKRFQISARGP